MQTTVTAFDPGTALAGSVEVSTALLGCKPDCEVGFALDNSKLNDTAIGSIFDR